MPPPAAAVSGRATRRPPSGPGHRPPPRELRRGPAQHLPGAARRSPTAIADIARSSTRCTSTRPCSGRCASPRRPPERRAHRAARLPAVRRPDAARLPDPHRLRRRCRKRRRRSACRCWSCARPPSAPRLSTPARRVLVGTQRDAIVAAAARLLTDAAAHARMRAAANPFGDGAAAPRIADAPGAALVLTVKRRDATALTSGRPCRDCRAERA